MPMVGALSISLVALLCRLDIVACRLGVRPLGVSIGSPPDNIVRSLRSQPGTGDAQHQDVSDVESSG